MGRITLKREAGSQQLIFDLLPKTSIDQAGFEFEKLLDKVTRKKTGQYYTPRSIVNYIIQNLPISEQSKILDPSCGCGSFLIGLYDKFKHFGHDFLKNLYGVDLNADAVNLTRNCLAEKAGGKHFFDSVLTANLKAGNSLINNRLTDKDSFDWQKEFNCVFAKGGFDFIVGNPPYVTLRKNKEFDPKNSVYSKIIHGPVNAASLMIGRSMELLKDGGVLAFLLPKSILYVDSYARLRNFISDNYAIEEIFDLGASFKDVRGEQIILFIKKIKPTKNHRIRIKVAKGKDIEISSVKTIKINQAEYVKYDRWLTFSSEADYSLIDKLRQNKQILNKIVDGNIFRGIPVGGNRTSLSKENAKKVIRGRDIKKFHITQTQFLSNKILETQSLSKVKSLLSRKIILQNIFSSEAGIIADFDDNDTITLDTITNIIVSSEEQGLFLLGLLSSKLLNYFLTFALFDCSRLTMHVDKAYIGQLPIIIPQERKKVQGIIKIVKELRALDDVKLKKGKMRELDCLVYKIYSLNTKEIKIIEEGMAEMLSARSLW